MKQFTWQLICKNFKKTLKINFLYLTRTLLRTNHTTSSTSVFSAHQHNEISWCAERQAVLLKETLVLREVTLVSTVEGQSLVRGSGDCFSSGKIQCDTGARKLCWCAEKMLVLLVVWLVRGSVRVRYKKLIFKVSLKCLHISCHVNRFIKMAFFRCVWSKFNSESLLVWSFKLTYPKI